LETVMNTVTIYIRLLGEGTEVARPTKAEEIEDGIFQALPTPDYDSEEEHWEFTPGAVVGSEKRAGGDGEFLVAVALMGR
jgi:hypothetical protein